MFASVPQDSAAHRSNMYQVLDASFDQLRNTTNNTGSAYGSHTTTTHTAAGSAMPSSSALAAPLALFKETSDRALGGLPPRPPRGGASEASRAHVAFADDNTDAKVNPDIFNVNSQPEISSQDVKAPLCNQNSELFASQFVGSQPFMPQLSQLNDSQLQLTESQPLSQIFKA